MDILNIISIINFWGIINELVLLASAADVGDDVLDYIGDELLGSIP